MTTLRPEHLHDLRHSGLSDATIAQMGVTSLDGMGLALGVHGPQSVQSAFAAHGYAIPYKNASGAITSTRYKVFWTNPLDEQGKKKPKYLSAVGQESMLYLPPGLDAVLAKTDYLLVTEGEKKAAKAVQEGYPCVALAGVYMWADSRVRHIEKGMGKPLTYLSLPMPELMALTKQRKVLIVFDSDSRTNAQVQQARYLLKDALLYHCASWVRIMDLPSGAMDEKKGLDDVLQDSVSSGEFYQSVLEELKKSSMGLVPLMRFAYSQSADGTALHYEVPNTPYGSQFNIHQVLKEVEELDDQGTSRVLRKRICTTRVWLSRLVQSADGDNKTLYELAYVPLDSREPKYMSGSSELIRLMRSNDDPLAEHGARVLGKEKAALEEFLNDCQTYGVRARKIPRVWGTRRRGWVDALGNLPEPGYVLPNRVITHGAVYSSDSREVPLLPVDTGYDGALKEALLPHGDYGLWRDAIRHYVLGSPLVCLFMSAGIAGLFRRWCPDSENFIVHLYGESSHGKTTAMRAAASIWGSPEKMIDNWRSTDNGLERRCAARNDMVMFLDESGMAVNDDIVRNSVYMIGNGGEKLRATRDAGDRVTRKFQLVALSTGEKQLIRDSKFAGQEVRALELHVGTFGESLWPTVKDGTDAEHFNSLMLGNYGWATEKIVRAMLHDVQQDPHSLHKIHQHFTQTLRATLAPSTPAHILRRVKHFGLLLTAWSYMLEHGLECSREESMAHMTQLVQQVAQKALMLETDQFRAGESQGILQHLVDQVTLHQSKFVQDEYDENHRGEIYGLLRDGKLYAIPSGLAKIMAPFDNARLVHIADTEGAMVYNVEKSKQNKKVTTRIGHMSPDCYVFDLKKIEKLLGRTS